MFGQLAKFIIMASTGKNNGATISLIQKASGKDATILRKNQKRLLKNIQGFVAALVMDVALHLKVRMCQMMQTLSWTRSRIIRIKSL